MFRLNGHLISCSKKSKKSKIFKRTFIPNLDSKIPRRVLFNVPGSDVRKLEKISKLDLDCAVLDFEDGVAQSEKEVARELIPEYLKRDKSFFGRAERSVRINGWASGHLEKDIEALVQVLDRVESIVLPKVEEGDDVFRLDRVLSSIGDSGKHIRILAAIESGMGVLNLKDICKSSSRLDALIFASEDYSADIGCTRTPGFQEFLFPRSQIVTHASAFNLQSIDMVCIDFKNRDQLEKEIIDGYNLGFTGKQAIHPAQIEPIYKYLCPPKEKIEFAQEILKTHQECEKKGIGAFEIQGKMIDLPMVKWAQKILEKANLH